MGLICNPTLRSLRSLSVGLIGYRAYSTNGLQKVDGCQLPYLDVGVTQVKVTPDVGSPVPLSNAVLTATGQVMVHAPEVVERPAHIELLFETLSILNLEMSRFVKL